jgi:hypothetical protein
MASPPLSPGPTPSEASSMLSDAPSKALLNRVEQELQLNSDLNDVDSGEAPSLEQTPREPRTYKSIDGTLYVEILIKKDKGKIRTGWYWQHGTEFEAQKKQSNGKNPRVWAYDRCKSF